MAAYSSYKFKPSHSRCPEPPKKHTLLAQWITRSYRFNSGVELLRADNQAPDSSLELLWHHSDAIMCCPLELEPVFTFANLVGLDALGTKLDHLKYMTLTNVLGSKNSFRVQNSAFTAEQDRKYVTIKSRVLYPKFRGRLVSAFLSHHFPEVADYNFTADMENEANFCYRKYEPRYSPWNYRSTSQNMAAYSSYKFKPSHSRCPEPPEKHTLLAQWITRSYRFNSGVELLRADNQASDSSLELLWHHSDAIMCCNLEHEPVFTFANLVGLDALGTTLDYLKYMTLTNVLGSKNSFRVQNSALTAEQDRKYVAIKSRVLYPKFRGRMVSAFLSHHFPEVDDYNFTADMENEGVAYLPAGIFGSWRRMGRYDQVLVWKVFNDEGRAHCMAFMFVNTSLLIE